MPYIRADGLFGFVVFFITAVFLCLFLIQLARFLAV
jgi:hypothetical protein